MILKQNMNDLLNFSHYPNGIIGKASEDAEYFNMCFSGAPNFVFFKQEGWVQRIERWRFWWCVRAQHVGFWLSLSLRTFSRLSSYLGRRFVHQRVGHSMATGRCEHPLRAHRKEEAPTSTLCSDVFCEAAAGTIFTCAPGYQYRPADNKQ